MKKSTLKRLALATAGLCLATGAPTTTHAQSGGPTPQAPAAVPLDGGASLLLAAGVGLGIRRLRRKRPSA